ncbi:MAG: TonB-dependent receptor [Enterobacterales bacterium]|nr:TonB-dependent receptor [Enterobacterales bacterium]
MVDFEKQTTLPNNLTSLIESIPGVAENGQPGLYQVVSIRGVSRQRILTLFEDVRLTSERRAGVAASFIDPLMLGDVMVTRGPVSTYYGSGAIGGVTQLDGDRSEGIKSLIGYKQSGNEQFQLLRWGDADGGISLSNRQAGNSEAINGSVLNTHFEQKNLMLQKNFWWSDLKFENFIFASEGNDLGRSNSRFPNRIVNIDKEKHAIFRSRLSDQDKWSASLYFHNQSTTSHSLKPAISRSKLQSESQDSGASWQTAWKSGNTAQLLGMDYFARRQVNIYETLLDLITQNAQQQQTLKQGFLDEFAIFYTQHKKFDRLRLQLGGRATFERSGSQPDQVQTSNSVNVHDSNQTAVTGFIGMAYHLSEHIEVNANVGNAFRFASLSERFFSGTTARGQVIGNPNLQAEKANTFDFGINASFAANQLKLNLFANQFKNYIQRIQLSNNSLTYINQDQGTIKGLELEYHYSFVNELELVLSGLAINGTDAFNQPLADVPSNRLNLQLFYHADAWQSNLKLQHRFAKNTTASGEIATDTANILSFSVSWNIDPMWKLSIYADNLLNERYFNSADDLSTLAVARNFGITIGWQNN